MDSILESIKKLLGIPSEYTQFDSDLIICINSVFLDVSQLGVGSSIPVSITGSDETWTDLFGDVASLIPSIRSYVHLKVRMIFDPPTSSAQTESINNIIKEIEWRMYIAADQTGDTDAASGAYSVDVGTSYSLGEEDYGVSLASSELDDALNISNAISASVSGANTGPADPFDFVKTASDQSKSNESENTGPVSYSSFSSNQKKENATASVGPVSYSSFSSNQKKENATASVGPSTYASFLASQKKNDTTKSSVGSTDPLKFIQSVRTKQSK